MGDPKQFAKAVVREDLARYRLRIGPSRVHRFGVFALEPIPTDRKIIPYTGELIGRRAAVRRGAGGRTYLMRINDYWLLDGSVGGSGAELINHSCEPNCRFDIRGSEVWIISLRIIGPREELLLDYCFSNKHPPVPCYCGAPACRGIINVKKTQLP